MIYLNSDSEKIEFYIEGFYWNDLTRFISIDETIETLLFVRCYRKDAKFSFIDPQSHTDGMEEFRLPTTLRRLNELIDDDYFISEFALLIDNRIAISQPMFDDLRFRTAPGQIELMGSMMLKAGLSESTTSFLKSNLGKFTQIDKRGNPYLVNGFSTLNEYFDFKYEKWNTEVLEELRNQQ